MILFLALTGARAGEASRLRLVDMHGDRAVLAESKSGVRTIWLPKVVLQLLASISKSESCPFVFNERGRPIPVNVVSAYWRSFRNCVRAKGMRLHDLRHGYASTAASRGEELKTIGALLGHFDFTSTLAYAHLAADAVSESAGRVSRTIERKVLGGASDVSGTDLPEGQAR